MKRIQILHRTEYNYRSPVRLGTHRAMMRPREGHDLRIESARVEIEPRTSIKWLRDIFGNSIAVLTFDGPTQRLCIESDVTVAIHE